MTRAAGFGAQLKHFLGFRHIQVQQAEAAMGTAETFAQRGWHTAGGEVWAQASRQEPPTPSAPVPTMGEEKVAAEAQVFEPTGVPRCPGRCHHGHCAWARGWP